MKTTLPVVTLLIGSLHFTGSSFAGGEYVAHEWGTFTSVQGADGVQMAWNPFVTAELPRFVYDWTSTNGIHGDTRLPNFDIKGSLVTLQRMETPVIYFYSGCGANVNATVDFPQGLITEWYPKANPSTSPLAKDPLRRKSLSWQNIQVLPNSGTSVSPAGLPTDKSGSHYYAARETDADLLRVNGQTEKFLFYRGVGNFRAPLTVTQSGGEAESITLQNTGTDELRHLFIYQVNGDRARYLHLDELAPATKREVKFGTQAKWSSHSVVREKITGHVQKSLLQEGLFQREATAMVKTWDDSWFGEQGVRVFYVLPREWTDRVLPLQLDPKPNSLARVMVGRAELITPQMEWNLMREIVRYSDTTGANREKAIEATRALGLGRFLQPAVQRLKTQLRSSEFARYSEELLQTAGRPVPEGKPLAAK